MDRTLPWLWLLLVLLGGPARAAVSGPVEVVRTTAEGIPADPGEVVTVGMRVAVDSGSERRLQESLELPEGWRLVTPASQLHLGAGDRRLRVLAVQVDPRAPAGDYELRYRVTDPQAPEVTHSATVRVFVARRSALSIEVLDAPGRVVAGDTVVVRLQVRNDGNTPLRGRIQATPESGLRATLSATELELEPRGTRDLRLTVETRADEERATNRIVRLEARAGDAEADGLVVVPISQRAERTRRFRTLPLTASLIGTTDTESHSLQAQVAGSGTLDADERWHTELLLRGPDVEGAGAFSQREEYRVLVEGPDATVRLGDQSYPLSPLTDPNGYGRGAGVWLTPGPVHVGAHVTRDRFVDDPTADLGVLAGAELTQLGTWTLEFHSPLEDAAAPILGLAASAPENDIVEVDAEIATTVTPESGSPVAGRVEAVGSWPSGLGFVARETFATPDFTGHERDVHRSELAATVPLSTDVVVHGSVRREERNLDADASQATAPTDGRAETRLVWSPDRAWRIDGGVAGAMRQDRLDGGEWREGALRLQLSRGARRLYASLQAVAGLRAESFKPGASQGGQVGLYVVATPDPNLSLRGWARWGSTEADEATSLFAVDRSVGTGLTWQLGERGLVEVDGRRSFGGAVPTDQGDLRLRYEIGPFGGPRPEVETRWQLRSGGEEEISGMLAVSVPIGMPVGRYRGAGSVEGRVFDADTLEALGLEGVTVTVGGMVATTDRSGRFSIGRLQPGTYSLDVDLNGVDVERIPTRDLPIEVEVRGGEIASVELGLARGAALSGRVVQVGRADQVGSSRAEVLGTASEVDRHGRAGVDVVLTHGQGIGGARRIVRTDAEGRFHLSGLRPGTWTASIARAELPVGYHLVDPGRPVVLHAGTQGELELELRAGSRRIHRAAGSGAVLTLQATTQSHRISDVRYHGDAEPAPRSRGRTESPRNQPAGGATPGSDAPAAQGSTPRPAQGGGASTDTDPTTRPTHAPPPSEGREPHHAAAVDAPAARVPSPATASWQGELAVTGQGVVVGGTLGLVVRDVDGASICTATGSWVDDGGDLPLVPCPDCAWSAHLAVADVQAVGPGCDGLETSALDGADASWGWTERYGTRRGVLLGWTGTRWRPVAWDVDPEVVLFESAADPPNPTTPCCSTMPAWSAR